MEIIIIDDNSTILKLLELMLKKEGFITLEDNLKTYLSIDSIPNLTLINTVDVIICDYDLGKTSINGLDFFKNILKDEFKNECVLLTGDDTFELRKKLTEIPSIHYVIKSANNDKSSTVNQLGKIMNTIREFKNVSK